MHGPRLPTPPLCLSFFTCHTGAQVTPLGRQRLRRLCQGVPGQEGAGRMTLATVMTSLLTDNPPVGVS